MGYQQQLSWECQGQQNSHNWSQLGQEASSSEDLTFLEEIFCLPGFFIASLILVLDYNGVHPHQETFSLSIWTPHQSPVRYGLLLHDNRAFSAGNEHSPLWPPMLWCLQPPSVIIDRDKKSTSFLVGPAAEDQVSLHFLGEELTSPRSPSLASLSDPSWRCCLPPSRELFQSHSQWVSHQSSWWLCWRYLQLLSVFCQ